MRLLITGGSSYLGQHLVPLATAVHETHYTFYQHDPLRLPGSHRLDVRDETAVQQLVTTLQPQAIIHTVGSNRAADMARVIEAGTEHVTRAAEAVGARLVHISTDVVFDGRHAPYDETAVPRPITEYGRAKAVAEQIVAAHADHAIIRTSLIYGLRLMDRGTAWMVAALRAGRPVTLFTNQRRNPIWAQTLGRACLELAGSDYRGILNVAGRQAMTRAEFALRMLDWWGVRERETLTFGLADPEKWPLDCRLLLERGTAVLSIPLPGVDDVLRQAHM